MRLAHECSFKFGAAGVQEAFLVQRAALGVAAVVDIMRGGLRYLQWGPLKLLLLAQVEQQFRLQEMETSAAQHLLAPLLQLTVVDREGEVQVL